MVFKKLLVTVVLAGFLATMLAGCGKSGESIAKEQGNKNIVVISREDGSGTRGAFVELFKIAEKKDGKTIDKTLADAAITNNTSVMMTTVAGNIAAIGYVSLGSLNDKVKVLKIDGAKASAENIKNKTYKIARPFNIATKGELKPQVKAFIDFIMAKEGQAVISKAGYIGNEKAAAYNAVKASGKVVVAGSSSVTPAMEKLKEAYKKINPSVEIEVQQSDSTTGMKSALSGVCDIGMASREAKKSELDGGLTVKSIAMDGIAVIVNKENKLDNLSKEQVKDIFTGVTKTWDTLK